RLVEEDGAIRLDPRAVVAAEQPRDRLIGDLAEQIPQSDIDATDGVFDGTAAPLPEGGLPQFLGDTSPLVSAFADPVPGQQVHTGGDQRLARHRAADADEPLVGDDLEEGVEVLLGLVSLWPAAIDGAAGQACDADIDDLHTLTPLVSRSSTPPAQTPRR